MSSSNTKITRRFALAGLASLAACGFEPLGSNGGNASMNALRGQISLPNAYSKETYVLRNQLASYFGEPSNPRYTLSIKYASSATSAFITQSSLGTRRRLTGFGSYSLTDTATNTRLAGRNFHREISYVTQSDVLANDFALEAAEEKAARAVADNIALEIIAAIGAPSSF